MPYQIMMLSEVLKSKLKEGKSTLLGVGPMSKNCVDAAIKVVNEYETNLMLVASRRQIEASSLGGGYVNNWTTEELSRYINANDRNGRILLARDHGGPWQNPIEIQKRMSPSEAMESAKHSYECDIRSGFKLIHIDCGTDMNGPVPLVKAIERIKELYEYCCGIAQKYEKKVIFEIGAEEQNGSVGDLTELEYLLSEMTSFCRKNQFPTPTFVVVQTGTLVRETSNFGTLESIARGIGEREFISKIQKLLAVCAKYGVYVKQHNTDYLPDEALFLCPKIGIHAANVAPEFGVVETRAFLDVLRSNRLRTLEDQFIELSFQSRKWEKWMLDQSIAGDYQKSIIAGHYTYSSNEFKEIKARAEKKLLKKGLHLDSYLQEKVAASILRYLKCFGLISTERHIQNVA